MLGGSNLVLVHRCATGRAFEPLLLVVLARHHAREFSASRAERIGPVSAALTKSETGGRPVGHGNGAMEADDLTAFATNLVAERAEVLVANATGSDWQGGISLAAGILDFDRLVDLAVGAGDGDVRAAVAARTVAFFAFDRSGRVHGFSSVVAVDHSHMNALCGRTGKQNLQALERVEAPVTPPK